MRMIFSFDPQFTFTVKQRRICFCARAVPKKRHTQIKERYLIECNKISGTFRHTMVIDIHAKYVTKSRKISYILQPNKLNTCPLPHCFHHFGTYIFGMCILSTSVCRPKSCQGRDLDTAGGVPPGRITLGSEVNTCCCPAEPHISAYSNPALV